MAPTADYYKQLLLKIYKPKIDFQLILTGRVTRRILGTYQHSKVLIRINNGNRGVEDCTRTAIHELAHHIHFTEQNGLNERPHGNEFKVIYHTLIALAVQKGLYREGLIDDIIAQDINRQNR